MSDLTWHYLEGTGLIDEGILRTNYYIGLEHVHRPAPLMLSLLDCVKFREIWLFDYCLLSLW